MWISWRNDSSAFAPHDRATQRALAEEAFQVTRWLDGRCSATPTESRRGLDEGVADIVLAKIVRSLFRLRLVAFLIWAIVNLFYLREGLTREYTGVLPRGRSV